MTDAFEERYKADKMLRFSSSSGVPSPSVRLMLPRAYAVVGAASATLLATLVAASLSTGPILGRQVASSPKPSPPLAVHRPVASGAPADGGTPAWFTVTMTVLLGLYAVALLVLVVLRGRGRDEDDEPDEVVDDEIEPAPRWGAILSVDLGDAAEAQLAALHLGTPRNAIVACWMSLQAATVGAGLPDVLSETPEEFMVRAVGGLGLDSRAITALGRLYREARFSDHVMVERQREQAGEALRVLAGQLADRRSEAAADRELEGVVR
jgi:hypothetical protein